MVIRKELKELIRFLNKGIFYIQSWVKSNFGKVFLSSVNTKANIELRIIGWKREVFQLDNKQTY